MFPDACYPSLFCNWYLLIHKDNNTISINLPTVPLYIISHTIMQGAQSFHKCELIFQGVRQDYYCWMCVLIVMHIKQGFGYHHEMYKYPCLLVRRSCIHVLHILDTNTNIKIIYNRLLFVVYSVKMNVHNTIWAM
jgi:hypothetical protein